MTVVVTHAFQTTKPDGSDATKVQGTAWNANHTVDLTGLVAADVTDFSEAVDDRVATLLVAGTNIAITYDDKANTLTVDASAPAIGSDTQIPFNDAGTMAGDAGLTWDKSTNTLLVADQLTFSWDGTPGNDYIIKALDSEQPSAIAWTAGSSNSTTATQSAGYFAFTGGTGSSPTTDGMNAGDGGGFFADGGSGGTPSGTTTANGAPGGPVQITAGPGTEGIFGGTDGDGGSVDIGSGYASGAGNAGYAKLFGNASLGTGKAGDVILEPGLSSGGGTNGALIFNNVSEANGTGNVTVGNLAPGTTALTILRWLDLTVDGTAYKMPLFG